MVLIMILVGVLIVLFAVGVIWFMAVKGSEVETMSRAQFDEAYDEMVAKGEIQPGDRDAAWRDFDARQASEERDRLFWEQAGEE